MNVDESNDTTEGETMKYQIMSDFTTEGTPTGTEVIKWYDKHTRSWVVQTKVNGCQEGEAVYVFSKREANLEIKWRLQALNGTR